MWKLPRPDITVIDALTACLAPGFRVDPELKHRLNQAKSEIQCASSILEASILAGETYSLHRSDFELSTVSNTEMLALYKNRMARPRSPARHVYDEILSAPEQGICPFCGQRDVSTLDHYVPKAVFPAAAIDPINLLPACRDCNFVKGVEVSTEPGKEPLHPYFDTVGPVQWLRARVIHVSPAVIEFYVDPSPEWTEIFSQRVRDHFRRFHLADLYGSHSATELNSIRLYLEDLYEGEDGAKTVGEHLQQIARAKRGARLNSWQTAMYESLAADKWFHEGNFRV
jgi:hypothetical protein